MKEMSHLENTPHAKHVLANWKYPPHQAVNNSYDHIHLQEDDDGFLQWYGRSSAGTFHGVGEKFKLNQFCDSNGIPIRQNDIIKVFHFKNSHRRRNCYMYKVVGMHEDQLWAFDIAEVFEKGKEQAHRCRLQLLYERRHTESVEVIDGYDREPGALATSWYDRKKVK